MVTVTEMLSALRTDFRAAGIEDPAAEARILIGGLLGMERVDFISRGEFSLDEAQHSLILAAARRRVGGEPPYRILGKRPFFGLELALSRGTLEPRPDTEILVAAVLDRLKDHVEDPLRILDLGTGTGAICLALLSHLPAATGVGVDLSEDALATAVKNAEAHGLTPRFATVHGNWFDAVSGRHDVIVSNPPYIARAVIPTLSDEVRNHDPLLALDGGEDGLEAYRVIAARAGYHLAPDGFVAVEIGFDQRHQVEGIFLREGFDWLEARKDYGGNDRVEMFGLKK